MSTILYIATLVGLQLAAAQHPVGPVDNYPRLKTYECTIAKGCVAQNTALVLDSLSHPIYQVNNPNANCGDWGKAADKAACPDAKTCQANCAMSAISDYSTHGVTTSGTEMKLKQVVNGATASPRVYILTPEFDKYVFLNLTGKEFTFDVDQSKLPCGMNSAVCLMEMEEDGGLGDLNAAGAAWGTGYCDAQCFTSPFINGVPNIDGGGACCNEMDIWEGNKVATSIAPHPCKKSSIYKCKGSECEHEGVCDEWGCGYNTYKNGDKKFYGPGSSYAVDTTRPFTVVTQFPIDRSGKMTQIKRVYVQNGKKIEMPNVRVSGSPSINYIQDDYCSATGMTGYASRGGTAAMGEAMARGMVVVFSIWWDVDGFMNWLDSDTAGPCSATEGDPKVIVRAEPNPEVTLSNIKWGEIGSTF